MIPGSDFVWQKNWASAIDSLHTETRNYNLQLAAQGSQNLLLSKLIDAINLDHVTQLSEKYKKIFLITEQPVDKLPPNVFLRQLPSEFYGCYCVDWPMPDMPIEKDFNCFLNRLDPIRQTWFYTLVDRGLLDRGHVSFNLHLRTGLQSPGMSDIEMFESHHRDFLSSFDHLKDQILKIVPYKNFVDDNDLFSISLKSKISVIVETYFERTDSKTFSEKTFRALQLPRPWLLFAATGCVERLRSMGFDVYDDLVDHSYDGFDTSITCVERHESILNQLPKLMDLEFTPKLLDRLYQGAEHNRNILKDWNSKWRISCFGKIHTAFLEAL
jgi:hypothetical protein